MSNKINIEDFLFTEETDSFEASTSNIWESDKIELSVYFENSEDYNKSLSDKINSINELLVWIKNCRKEVEMFLLEDDWLSMAEDWASSAEEAEDEESECYVMEDGQKVFFPITEDDFKKSLSLSSIRIEFEDDRSNPTIELYLVCNPDYFAYHGIEITINESKEITDASLVG